MFLFIYGQSMSVVRNLSTVLCAAALMVSTAIAADRDDLPFELAENLPEEIIAPLAKLTVYAYESRINPFYLQGDFDGDGARDTVVLVKEKSSGKSGFALVLKRRVEIIGAGRKFSESDNYDWVNAWQVQRKGRVGQGADGTAPPKLKGDALLVIRMESSSGLIYWDGKRFRWYQQGD